MYGAAEAPMLQVFLLGSIQTSFGMHYIPPVVYCVRVAREEFVSLSYPHNVRIVFLLDEILKCCSNFLHRKILLILQNVVFVKMMVTDFLGTLNGLITIPYVRGNGSKEGKEVVAQYCDIVYLL